MGALHARAMASLEEYELVAVCDIRKEVAEAIADELGCEVYTDYDAMLAEVRPDVVAIATPTYLHAEMAFKAIEAGVRGIYCEKPMATNLADARKMVELCRERGIALAVNHQRRLSAVHYKMRRLLEEGAIGEVYLIRGSCGGDVMSDGTHTIDTILHLAGDPEVRWVFGQIYREEPRPGEGRSMGFHPSGGWRFGHMIENGAMAVFELGNGWRAEIFTGGMSLPGRRYQDIEAFGTRGRLWHPGDGSDPPLLIWNEGTSGWSPVPMDDIPEEVRELDPITYGYRLFARTVKEGAHHPLRGENALRGFEVVMAVYESARLRAKLALPLRQDRFPLELMFNR